MRFIPNYAWLYAIIAYVKPVYRYVLTALVLVTILYVWLFGFYFRLNAVIAQYQREARHALEQRELPKQAMADYRHRLSFFYYSCSERFTTPRGNL